MKSSATIIQYIAAPRNAAVLALAALTLFAVSFQSGRWTQRVVNQAQILRKQTKSPPKEPKNNHPERANFEKVLIANVATVGFDELYNVLRSAPERSREQWVQELGAMPDGAQRTAALKSFYKTFVQIDPAAATASIDILTDVDTKMTAAEAMVGAVPASGFQYVAAILLKLPREFVSTHSWDYLDDIFREWSSIDPEALARFFDEHPNNDLENYHGALIFNWAQLDPDAARAWLERQPQPKEKGLFPPFDDLVSGWFEKDRVAAENYLIAHANEEKLRDVIGRVAAESFLLSPAEATSFMGRLRGDDLKKVALKDIAEISHRWSWPSDSDRAPSTIADWMLGFPQQMRGEAMATVIENWKEQDVQELNVWLNQLPPATRDQVALNYCYNFGMYDEQFLVPLAMNISGISAREAAIEDFLSKWLPQDHDEAIQKIRDSPLTDVQKTYLTKLFAKMRKNSPSE